MTLRSAPDPSISESGVFLPDRAYNPQKSRHRTGNRKFYLHPGQIFVSSEPVIVTTILGSCVSVCLWDRTKRTGGINHYLLPYGPESVASATKYGNVALGFLLKKILELGARKCDLEAKLFGGACVIEAFKSDNSHLGMKNVQAARFFLSNEGIPVVGEDVGKQYGRKLVFHLEDGSVWVKRLG